VKQVVFPAEVVIWAEVALDVVSSVEVARVEVPLFLYVSTVSVDFLCCQLGKKGIRPFDFDEASPGVLLSQRSRMYALET
jgi:hypothetical protein